MIPLLVKFKIIQKKIRKQKEELIITVIIPQLLEKLVIHELKIIMEFLMIS